MKKPVKALKMKGTLKTDAPLKKEGNMIARKKKAKK